MMLSKLKQRLMTLGLFMALGLNASWSPFMKPLLESVHLSSEEPEPESAAAPIDGADAPPGFPGAQPDPSKTSGKRDVVTTPKQPLAAPPRTQPPGTQTQVRAGQAAEQKGTAAERALSAPVDDSTKAKAAGGLPAPQIASPALPAGTSKPTQANAAKDASSQTSAKPDVFTDVYDPATGQRIGAVGLHHDDNNKAAIYTLTEGRTFELKDNKLCVSCLPEGVNPKPVPEGQDALKMFQELAAKMNEEVAKKAKPAPATTKAAAANTDDNDGLKEKDCTKISDGEDQIECMVNNLKYLASSDVYSNNPFSSERERQNAIKEGLSGKNSKIKALRGLKQAVSKVNSMAKNAKDPQDAEKARDLAEQLASAIEGVETTYSVKSKDLRKTAEEAQKAAALAVETKEAEKELADKKDEVKRESKAIAQKVQDALACSKRRNADPYECNRQYQEAVRERDEFENKTMADLRSSRDTHMTVLNDIMREARASSYDLGPVRDMVTRYQRQYDDFINNDFARMYDPRGGSRGSSDPNSRISRLRGNGRGGRSSGGRYNDYANTGYGNTGRGGTTTVSARMNARNAQMAAGTTTSNRRTYSNGTIATTPNDPYFDSRRTRSSVRP